MTVEEKIPLDSVKYALYNYSCLYRTVNNPKYVFDYKTKVARKTFISLIVSLVKLALLVVFIALASTASSDTQPVFIILAIIMGIFVLLDLFYRQKLPDKKFKKLRFRYTYYIQCLAQDIYEIHWFRKYFGVKTPAIALMFGAGKSVAYSNIEDWGYMIGEDYLKVIDQYKQKYSHYRDYVNLDNMWYMCDELLQIINSGRAVDIQSALAVVDTRAHQKRIENIAQNAANRVVEAHKRAADAVERASNSVERAADSVDDAARAEEKYWDAARNSLNNY